MPQMAGKERGITFKSPFGTTERALKSSQKGPQTFQQKAENSPFQLRTKPCVDGCEPASSAVS